MIYGIVVLGTMAGCCTCISYLDHEMENKGGPRDAADQASSTDCGALDKLIVVVITIITVILVFVCTLSLQF